jgi:hypothetical protein
MYHKHAQYHIRNGVAMQNRIDSRASNGSARALRHSDRRKLLLQERSGLFWESTKASGQQPLPRTSLSDRRHTNPTPGTFAMVGKQRVQLTIQEAIGRKCDLVSA